MEWAKGCRTHVWWSGDAFRRMTLDWKAKWNWFQDGGAEYRFGGVRPWMRMGPTLDQPNRGCWPSLGQHLWMWSKHAMLMRLPWPHWNWTPSWATASTVVPDGGGHQYLNWSHQNTHANTLFPNLLSILSKDSPGTLTEEIRNMNPSHLIPTYTLQELIQSPWDWGFGSSPQTLSSTHKKWKKARDQRTHHGWRFRQSQVNAFIPLPLVHLSPLLLLMILLLLLLLDWDWESLRRFKHEQI